LPFFANSKTAVAGHGIGGGDVPSMALVLGAMEELAVAMEEALSAMKEVLAAATGGGGGRGAAGDGMELLAAAWR
jgi:hypothetical protein